MSKDLDYYKARESFLSMENDRLRCLVEESWRRGRADGIKACHDWFDGEASKTSLGGTIDFNGFNQSRYNLYAWAARKIAREVTDLSSEKHRTFSDEPAAKEGT